MSALSLLTSIVYTLLVGSVFIFLFKLAYEFFYGENEEKQLKKIHKYFRKKSVKKITKLEHEPRKYTIYQVVTNDETLKIKLKPGYKVIKMVPKKEKQK
jgi:predicted PurR-regulated permease PerM